MSLAKTLMIANRGQIACRIIRTAKDMGIKTVAIYSDADSNSKFVNMADKAYRVGGNLSSQSYLNSDKILQIALQSQCQALHPGFGFLSQNAQFAQQCQKSGISFVGPPSSAIIAMGSKSQSKKIMQSAQVPVVPGYHQQNQDPQHLWQQANKIGYPVLIKAVSGGGGKGMRIVQSKQSFPEALQSCKRQSLKAFKDDRVIIQKYIKRSSHIEVQVFADKHENYVHLYERDCSIQRRHQKVVQQAPSMISDQIRYDICKAAVDAAKAVKYVGAGTVQFIFDVDQHKHYFMEMNTRLQVQHPISQMITGEDFVRWQLLVAGGFPLPKKQSQIKKKGNSIQVRIYSEDPFNNFLPGNGKLNFFKQPKQSQGVRIQTGVRQNDTISTFYDPMIAKLITYGKDRNQAIDLMKKALSQYRVVGLPNNLKFLKRVIEDPKFVKGDFDTSYIPENIDNLLKKQKPSDKFDLICAMIARGLNNGPKLPADLINFRNIPTPKYHKIVVQETSIDGKLQFNASIEFKDGKSGVVTIDNQNYQFVFQQKVPGAINVKINGQIRKVQYFVNNTTVHIFDHKGDSIGYKFESDHRIQSKQQQGGAKKAITPMPGTISKVFVQQGQQIKKGDAIFAMQAMKMEHVIRASGQCKVKKILYKQGSFVESGKQIVQLQ